MRRDSQEARVTEYSERGQKVSGATHRPGVELELCTQWDGVVGGFVLGSDKVWLCFMEMSLAAGGEWIAGQT